MRNKKGKRGWEKERTGKAREEIGDRGGKGGQRIRSNDI